MNIDELSDTGEKPIICFWRYVVDDDTYESACKNTFQFTAGGPGKDNFHFCPYCGGEIEVLG